MPLKIIRQDITKIKCDAIVNPTDRYFSHGGGVDKAIHDAAGAALASTCLEYGELEVSDAVLTSAFSLPCKYVIHTVGPRWYGGDNDEELRLRACYTACLALAASNNFKSIAFPLISSGTFGFPKDRVLKIATEVIADFLFSHEMLVYVVVYDKDSYEVSGKLFADIETFLDDTYADHEDEFDPSKRTNRGRIRSSNAASVPADYSVRPCRSIPCLSSSLEDMLNNLNCGFAETLFSFIDEKGITDVECYKRANVDKKTFSKIKCNKDYKPSKVTAVSFAIALRLNINETNRLLNTVGMSLSRSSKFDVIIEYFITTGNYESIFDVNEVLYKLDQITLGV